MGQNINFYGKIKKKGVWDSESKDKRTMLCTVTAVFISII